MLKNYYISAKSAFSSGMSLYELDEKSFGKTDQYKNGEGYLCLIEYFNPLREEIRPSFYKIVNEKEFNGEVQKTHQHRIDLSPSLSKAEYLDIIQKLKREIGLGNIYELNFCMEFVAQNAEIDPKQIFCKLHQLSKAPYSSLLKIDDEYIICASPELFLKREGNKLSTKPIKGTAKRGKTAEEDERLKEELCHSKKERTENVMAVDVARNDLSVVAQRGTVGVNKLYNIESFETVHQMVSTVHCDLKDDLAFNDIINATFPMASMTGAPKISAMNLIDAYENFERKYYSGAMGIIDEEGDFELCVIIRSIFYNERTKRLSFAVGSAITHLSDPEQEYSECMLKAEALVKALNGEIKRV